MKLLNTVLAVTMITASHQLFSQTTNEKKAREIIEKAIQAEGGIKLTGNISSMN
ncbi:hypothetical protein [Chryseobacterium sp. R2ACT005]|uniref:hypothetical protein n=1 Tax=Chryseobacterium sp. R2ACT005 TaxID=3416668 RepID=UPI003CEADD55